MAELVDLPAGRRVRFRTMHFVYVLQSLKTGELYKGLTDNFDRRLFQHSNGKIVSTKNRLPFRIIHVELCETRVEARKMEKFFKSGFGRETIKEIVNSLPGWRNW